jgi:hypothetical protein
VVEPCLVPSVTSARAAMSTFPFVGVAADAVDARRGVDR